ncbi:sensor histidine kinase [Lactiplantibacillus sp. WILCCON 0030]|uniref:histidine kinase n=1 Tax=Lactiplantibacillus brownii TaxID=3069269 RepID=A0ABU1A8P4_9LACO|nr:sensor histidine kinase [Lactiplantibacillus brownii]MDQ7937299.1 sensor histidine kinase [Lactiplantibacillus brownii]
MSKPKWLARIKDLEWTSYIWLGYLPYSVAIYLPAKTAQDWFWLSLLAIFLVLYILVVEKSTWRPVTIPLELLITGLFSIFKTNNYLIIFPGWQISFILAQHPKKYFYWFLTGYYGFILASLIEVYQSDPNMFGWHNGDIMGLVFPILSPLLSYTLSRSIVRQRQLRQTNRRLQTIIQRDERDRIARDLHDTLGQSFSMITLKTELAKKLLVKAPNKVGPELDDIERTSRENLQLVRSIVNDLHQKSISEVLLEQNQNLLAANVWLVTTGEKQAIQWPTTVQGIFAATLVEALTNVIRHAHAQQVQLGFSEVATQYQVVVQDNGRGGPLERAGANGITGMRARLLAAHGTFEIGQSGHGTRLILSLPKEEYQQ